MAIRDWFRIRRAGPAVPGAAPTTVNHWYTPTRRKTITLGTVVLAGALAYGGYKLWQHRQSQGILKVDYAWSQQEHKKDTDFSKLYIAEPGEDHFHEITPDWTKEQRLKPGTYTLRVDNLRDFDETFTNANNATPVEEDGQQYIQADAVVEKGKSTVVTATFTPNANRTNAAKPGSLQVDWDWKNDSGHQKLDTEYADLYIMMPGTNEWQKISHNWKNKMNVPAGEYKVAVTDLEQYEETIAGASNVVYDDANRRWVGTATVNPGEDVLLTALYDDKAPAKADDPGAAKPAPAKPKPTAEDPNAAPAPDPAKPKPTADPADPNAQPAPDPAKPKPTADPAADPNAPPAPDPAKAKPAPDPAKPKPTADSGTQTTADEYRMPKFAPCGQRDCVVLPGTLERILVDNSTESAGSLTYNSIIPVKLEPGQGIKLPKGYVALNRLDGAQLKEYANTNATLKEQMKARDGIVITYDAAKSMMEKKTEDKERLVLIYNNGCEKEAGVYGGSTRSAIVISLDKEPTEYTWTYQPEKDDCTTATPTTTSSAQDQSMDTTQSDDASASTIDTTAKTAPVAVVHPPAANVTPAPQQVSPQPAQARSSTQEYAASLAGAPYTSEYRNLLIRNHEINNDVTLKLNNWESFSKIVQEHNTPYLKGFTSGLSNWQTKSSTTDSGSYTSQRIGVLAQPSQMKIKPLPSLRDIVSGDKAVYNRNLNIQ